MSDKRTTPTNPRRRVVRRRKGQQDKHIDTRTELGIIREVLGLDPRLNDVQRLVEMADLMAKAAMTGSRRVKSNFTLRPDQAKVFGRYADFLDKKAKAAVSGANETELSRVIQPPRTGKTVIYGEVIAALGCTALVLVPTKDLVHQVATKLAEQLPTVQIGKYYGDEKVPVNQGIIVATYQIIEAHHAAGKLPRAVRNVDLIIADEGHRAMTEKRQRALHTAFRPLTVITGFTASPDYDEKRIMANFFPELIHEISLEEAIAMNLLAPVEAWVLQVDVDASLVEARKGKYDSATLARVMSEAPVFEAARAIRYLTDDNASKGALIVCRNRQQAYDLHRYLMEHKPVGAHTPELVIGTTSDKERRAKLQRFENGKRDTLIVVQMLIEGWDSKRCKLLIDLSPTLSKVVAEQKFLRPMTKDGAVKALIYLLIPNKLKRLPIFPVELFGSSVQIFGMERILAEAKEREEKKRKQKRSTRKESVSRHGRTPIESVEAKTRILVEGFKPPELDASDAAAIREVIKTHYGVSYYPPSKYYFRTAWFTHRAFTGTGKHLMQFCGIRNDKKAYRVWMELVFPEASANELLLEGKKKPAKTHPGGDTSFDEAAFVMANQDRVTTGTMRALGGPSEAIKTPEELLETKQLAARNLELLNRLSDRQRFVIIERVIEEKSLGNIGKQMGVSKERVRQIERKARERLRDLRRRSR